MIQYHRTDVCTVASKYSFKSLTKHSLRLEKSYIAYTMAASELKPGKSDKLLGESKWWVQFPYVNTPLYV